MSVNSMSYRIPSKNFKGLSMGYNRFVKRFNYDNGDFRKTFHINSAVEDEQFLRKFKKTFFLNGCNYQFLNDYSSLNQCLFS